MNSKDENLLKIKASKVFQSRRWKVLRCLTRIQDFPRFMHNVKKCLVMEKGPGFAITLWNVEVDNIPLSWKEKEEFDFKNFRIHFTALEGDLEH